MDAVVGACESGPCRSVTITSGSFAASDKVVREYAATLAAIRARTNTSLHFQHEPVTDLTLHETCAEYAQSVGVFLEILQEDLRKRICPGKAQVPLDGYIKNWQAAVKAYGRGNVMNTCILGFDEDWPTVLQAIDSYAELGVMTMVLLLRPQSRRLQGHTPSYLLRPVDELVDFFIEAVASQRRHGIHFHRQNAGCIGCQGCSAGFEAAQVDPAGLNHDRNEH